MQREHPASLPVSVVIPVHDREVYLAAAVESVLRQTRPPQQVILIDDGSTDGSAAVALGFGDAVIYRRQANLGMNAARNHGIALADREMIAFLDDDDLWPADSLERRWSMLSARPELGCVFGGIEQFTADDPHRIAPRAGRLVGAMLARRSVFDRIGGFDETLRMGEMMQWCGRLEAAGIASGMVDAIVLRRRIHAGNNSHRLDQQSDYIKVLRARLRQRRDVEA